MLPGAVFEVQAAFGSAVPYIEELLDRAGSEVEGRVILSMTPIDSRLSCGRLCHHLLATPGEAPARVIARLWDDSRFLAVNLAHLFSQLELPARATRCALVLVLHGTLVRDGRGRVPAFHTGLEETKTYAARLREAIATDARTPFARIEVAFLNHDVGGEWTRPTLSEVLEDLAADGVDAVAAYPCEYLVDGSDTVGKVAAILRGGPIAISQRVACLNDSPAFIDYLALRVEEALAGGEDARPGAPSCSRCPRAV
jgi:ferrochelatase